MSDNERNNDLSCLVLLTGKVLFCLIVSVLSAIAVRPKKRPELCRDRRNVCLAAGSLSLSPHAVNSNIKPAENQQAAIL